MKSSKIVDKANVSFRFYDIMVDNVPFCDKKFSLIIHFRYNSFSTDVCPSNDFVVKWNNRKLMSSLIKPE